MTIPGPELEAEVGEVPEHDRGTVAENVEARPHFTLQDLCAVPRDGAEVADQKRRVAAVGHLASDVQEGELFLAVGGCSCFGVVLDDLHVQSVVRCVLVRGR